MVVTTASPRATLVAFSLYALSFTTTLVAVAASQSPPTCPSNDKECHARESLGCRLYYAPDGLGNLGLFAGKDYQAGEPLADPDILLPWLDPNKNEFSAWHDIAWGTHPIHPFLALDSDYLQNVVLPGIPSLAACIDEDQDPEAVTANAVLVPPPVHDDSPTTKGRRPHGGLTPFTDWQVVALRDVVAGEEIRFNCAAVTYMPEDVPNVDLAQRFKRSMSWLKLTGVCVDNGGLTTTTNIQQETASKTVLATRDFAKGQVVATSPVVVMDRSQMERVQQDYRTRGSQAEQLVNFVRSHGIDYTDQVLGHQVGLNYCFGMDQSQVLLLPVAPVVNGIHRHSREANVAIRFVEGQEYLLEMPLMELLDQRFGEMDAVLFVEYVALTEIAAGDEVFLDYGSDWTEAWRKYEEEEKRRLESHEDDLEEEEFAIRTLEEQEEQPYPEEFQTVCQWSIETPFMHACVRPCDVLSREETSDDDDVSYTVRVYSRPNDLEECGGPLNEAGILVSGLAADDVSVVLKAYKADYIQEGAFRHTIGVPDGLYPEHWMAVDAEPMGDFIGSKLAPGQMAPIRWNGSANVVTPWAFRVGVPSSVREVLLEYCEKMGIIDIFRHVTVKGNGLPPDNDINMVLPGGTNWFLQRPDENWRSNLHWLSPLDNRAHEHYLQALGVAGFDQVLQGVGDYLGMDGLVAFHVTFIAVSHSTRGFLHHDVLQTGAKTYNVIVPLILVNETGPELDLADVGLDLEVDVEEEDYEIGRYRYEYDVASMMGDGAVHATSAVDYRRHKKMRMAATIYIADVRDWNAEGILNEYTQAYPPREKSLLMSWAGRHWRRDDPTVKLPRPTTPDHVLYERAQTMAAEE